jgi:hypothetical protein
MNNENFFGFRNSLLLFVGLDLMFTQMNNENFSLAAHLLGFVCFLNGTFTCGRIARIFYRNNDEAFITLFICGASIGSITLFITDQWGVWTGILWSVFGPITSIIVSTAVGISLTMLLLELNKMLDRAERFVVAALRGLCRLLFTKS